MAPQGARVSSSWADWQMTTSSSQTLPRHTTEAPSRLLIRGTPSFSPHAFPCGTTHHPLL